VTFKRIRLKRGTWAEWTAENPVLRDGEPGYITGGLNAGRMKVGNGTTAFLELPFVLADQTFDVEAAQDAAAQLLLNGTHTNVEVFYDDGAQAINLTTEFGITVEQAQDAAAGLFETGIHSGIVFVYDDTTGKINATVEDRRTRQTVSATTASLADGASAELTMELGQLSVLLEVTISHASWLRFYRSAAQRAADTRVEPGGTLDEMIALGDAKPYAEIVTTVADETVALNPVATLPGDVSGLVYVAIRNDSGAPATIEINTIILTTEA
jgi:hypothetical protein